MFTFYCSEQSACTALGHGRQNIVSTFLKLFAPSYFNYKPERLWVKIQLAEKGKVLGDNKPNGWLCRQNCSWLKFLIFWWTPSLTYPPESELLLFRGREGKIRSSFIFIKFKIIFHFWKNWGSLPFLKHWGCLPFLKSLRSSPIYEKLRSSWCCVSFFKELGLPSI